MSDLLLVNREDGILHVTLNRPEKRNALNMELCRALVEAFAIDADAILLDAAGPVFCAGMDLIESQQTDDSQLSMIHDSLFTAGARLTTPLVAAVDGPALAGGTGLVANAHIVVAAPRATFGLTEIRVGLWPLLVYRAVALAIGERRATELSLTGRIITATEAHAIGLVTEVSETPAARAREIAVALAASSRAAIRTGLSYVRESRGLAREKAGELARNYRKPLIESAEYKTAVDALLHKKSR